MNAGSIPPISSGSASDPARRMRMTHDRPNRSAQAVRAGAVHSALLHADLWQGLHREHRLRYNQLFGVRINEYIMMLEADLVERLLAPLRRHREVAGITALVRCIDTMIEEERQHFVASPRSIALVSRQLYEDSERLLLRSCHDARALFAAVGLVAGPTDLRALVPDGHGGILNRAGAGHDAKSLDCARRDRARTFAAVHREHMKDELRHLQIDGIVIDLCLGRSGRARRAPQCGAVQVDAGRDHAADARAAPASRSFASWCARCRSWPGSEEEMIAECCRCGATRQFQTSLFNRQAMPLTFGVFDRHAQNSAISATAMVGYDRR